MAKIGKVVASEAMSKVDADMEWKEMCVFLLLLPLLHDVGSFMARWGHADKGHATGSSWGQ
jgi:hypothetical protein